MELSSQFESITQTLKALINKKKDILNKNENCNIDICHYNKDLNLINAKILDMSELLINQIKL